jgi:hypothetical protein
LHGPGSEFHAGGVFTERERAWCGPTCGACSMTPHRSLNASGMYSATKVSQKNSTRLRGRAVQAPRRLASGEGALPQSLRAQPHLRGGAQCVPRGHQKPTRQPKPPPPRLRRRTVVPEARARVRSPTTLPGPGSPRPAGARWRTSRMAQRRPLEPVISRKAPRSRGHARQEAREQ